VKTKYFFLWTQFIDERRAIKALKNKEIEDLKKAKVFHQYSLKFRNFVEWKHYVQYMKVTRQKGVLLEERTKKKMMRGVVEQIKEKLGTFWAS
jgi:hypothetical protein